MKSEIQYWSHVCRIGFDIGTHRTSRVNSHKRQEGEEEEDCGTHCLVAATDKDNMTNVHIHLQISHSICFLSEINLIGKVIQLCLDVENTYQWYNVDRKRKTPYLNRE